MTGGLASGGSILGRLRPPDPWPGKVVGLSGPVGRVVGRPGGSLSSPPIPGEGRVGPSPGRGAGFVVGSFGFTIPPPGNAPGRRPGVPEPTLGLLLFGLMFGLILGRVIGLGRVLLPSVLLPSLLLPCSEAGKFGLAEGRLGRADGSLEFPIFPPPLGSLGWGIVGRVCGAGRLALGRACGPDRPPPPPTPPFPKLPRCWADSEGMQLSQPKATSVQPRQTFNPRRFMITYIPMENRKLDSFEPRKDERLLLGRWRTSHDLDFKGFFNYIADHAISTADRDPIIIQQGN